MTSCYAIARRPLHIALFLLLLCILFPVRSFARPVTVAVVGDSIATELGDGMQGLFRHSRDVRVIKRTRYSTGLVRTDYFNWDRVLREFLRHHHADAIAVVMGGNDRQSFFVGHHRLQRFSPEWRRHYAQRVARFMRILKGSHAKIFWVGLPKVESHQMTHDYHILNSIYRREAKRFGFNYVSVWDTFSNSNGAYTSFGRIDGRRRRLRKHDGMHFTEIGSRVLALHVARAMGLR